MIFLIPLIIFYFRKILQVLQEFIFHKASQSYSFFNQCIVIINETEKSNLSHFFDSFLICQDRHSIIITIFSLCKMIWNPNLKAHVVNFMIFAHFFLEAESWLYHLSFSWRSKIQWKKFLFRALNLNGCYYIEKYVTKNARVKGLQFPIELSK